ncbi:MAG: DUF2914 domain-containing protein [Deltaproteobacteria bacterium]|nr:DUF2914 domain-containing protein [Deltaproteobacteria bacterium]
MTARSSLLSLVLVASQLVACGGATVATPENVECRCAPSQSAQPASTTATAPAAPALPTAASAPATAPAPANVALVSTRGATQRPMRLASNPETRSSGGLRVHRIVLARGVANRVPVEAGERFVVGGPDERLYTWVEVENAGEEAAELVFTWIPPQGVARGGQALEVPSARRWRTWAFTRQARTPGEWTAEVRTVDGELLARQSFVVEAPAPATLAVPRS